MTINPDRIAVAGKPHVYFGGGCWYVRWPDDSPYRVRGVAQSLRVLGRDMFMARIRAETAKRQRTREAMQ